MSIDHWAFEVGTIAAARVGSRARRAASARAWATPASVVVEAVADQQQARRLFSHVHGGWQRPAASWRTRPSAHAAAVYAGWRMARNGAISGPWRMGGGDRLTHW
jgi:hypothetical protein